MLYGVCAWSSYILTIATQLLLFHVMLKSEVNLVLLYVKLNILNIGLKETSVYMFAQS